MYGSSRLYYAERGIMLDRPKVTRPVLPVFRKQRSGHIITISSTAGSKGIPSVLLIQHLNLV